MYQLVSLDKLSTKQTPYYYYDTALLKETLQAIKTEIEQYERFQVHYAVKANANAKLLNIISQAGLEADCVSGGEILAAIDTGFSPNKIVYAGVGKSDWEIALGIDQEILCFNVESIAELEIINEIAEKKGKIARIALRINPDVEAHTHANITTGLAENKFGIAMCEMKTALEACLRMKNVRFTGLHFHIGSQILDMRDFVSLCDRINQLQEELHQHHVHVESINVGGGLGVSYEHPDQHPIPDFKAYFQTYAQHLKLYPHQTLHFELGRSIVAQCGSLITKVLYVKQGVRKKFCIVDAGMTDFIRPALYQSRHQIENLSSKDAHETYDVVGPICESSDVFAKAIDLNQCHRGDLLAIRSAGAYGEVMASQYNCRKLPEGFLTEDL